MKNQSRFASTDQFGQGLVFLLLALFQLGSAMRYTGSENNFLSENWGNPLIILLTLLFGTGWWFEGFVEYLLVSRGRKNAILAILGMASVSVFLLLGSVIFAPSRSFIQPAMWASGCILISGFLFHFSVIRPEIKAKLKARN